MSTLKLVGAAALCGLLAGCGHMDQAYTPTAGVPQTQTADAAYWDCVRQGWQQPNVAWIPLPAAQGMGAAQEMGYVKACMIQRGWTPRPHLELTTMTWQP